jgi:hypothetical protein
VRKSALVLVLFVLVLLSSSGFVGCTSLLGDFTVSATSGEGGTDGSTGGDGPMCMASCGSNPCVDLTSDSANCGACGTACAGGQTCQASACKCPQDKAFCGGQCVAASRMACGPSCTSCLSDEVCNQGCTAAPAPAFDKTPLDPTGWKDSAGQPISFKIKPTNVPGTLYECRTGPEAAFTPTDPPWKPCDGGSGLTPTHTPVKSATTPEGSYRTEYRYRSDSYRSPTASYQFYVHSSLDSVGTCPAAGVPPITDAEYFIAAAQFVGFPGTDQFPNPGTSPTDAFYIRDPWIKIPFTGVHTVAGMATWPAPGAPFDHVVNERSLRHKFVLNQQRTMLLMKRQYAHPKTRDCKNRVDFGSQLASFRGPAGRGVHKLDCEAFVVNVHGQGICIGRNAQNKPAAIPLDAKPAPAPAYGYFQSPPGTATGALNGTTVTISAGSYVAFMANHWIYMDTANNYTSRWYKVASVAGQVLTLAEPLKFAYTNVGWKYSPTTNLDASYITTTGFAHLYDDGKNWGTHGTLNPSWHTKCETPGCNTGKPWLTYLPP